MNSTLTEQDHQLLSQFVDGELPAAVARDLERRLACEPALKMRLGELQNLDNTLRGAFAAPGLETVPPHIRRLLNPVPAGVIPLRPRRSRHWGYALAASLAVALCGTLVTQWEHAGNAPGTGFDSSLARALEQTPSSGSQWTPLADGSKVRPILSFRSDSGEWCREYELAQSTSTYHGVACRHDQQWRSAVVVEKTLSIGPGEYRPAGSAEPASVAAFVDQHLVDIPLDAGQEAALISAGWQ